MSWLNKVVLLWSYFNGFFSARYRVRAQYTLYMQVALHTPGLWTVWVLNVGECECIDYVVKIFVWLMLVQCWARWEEPHGVPRVTMWIIWIARDAAVGIGDPLNADLDTATSTWYFTPLLIQVFVDTDNSAFLGWRVVYVYM